MPPGPKRQEPNHNQIYRQQHIAQNTRPAEDDVHKEHQTEEQCALPCVKPDIVGFMFEEQQDYAAAGREDEVREHGFDI